MSGNALVLASALAIAVYYVLSIELVRRYSAMTVAAWTSLAGALAMLPLMAWELQAGEARPSLQGVAIVLYLAVLVTVAGVYVWLRELTHLPARIAASLQYLQPLVGVTASAAIFDDRMGPWFAVGTACVLVGILLSASPDPARRAAPGA